MHSSVVCTMDTLSSFAFYGFLLLGYSSLNGIDTVSINQNVLSQSQNANETSLSDAERFRRLVPYVTYYVVGNNDQNDVPYQYQYQNSNPNTPRPLQGNNFYFQNERKPQQKPQPAAVQHQQHNYQISDQQVHHQQQHATSPEYLRFPSSPKLKRPIILATTTALPYVVHQTEDTYNYYYDYSQTTPRPIFRSSPNVIKHGDHAGFLPTIPPTPNSFLEQQPHQQQQQQQQFSTKAKKPRRPKPKRPTTPVTTTTTTDKYGALNDLLDGYDLGNRLSNKITAENIGSSIQTLSAVLQILQNEADVQQVRPALRPKKPETEYRPDPIDEYDSGDEGNQGRPGVDYPTLSVIPKTSFDCKTQRYKGFFGDPETLCQVWHYCDLNGGQASFLCPNGTIFNQVSLTCDWWFNVKCDTTAQLYVLNERLYKYIIPSKPSFPEDYEGPLVDRYLEDKFKETEKKRSQQRAPMPSVMNVTTVGPESVRTPYQQLLDVDV